MRLLQKAFEELEKNIALYNHAYKKGSSPKYLAELKQHIYGSNFLIKELVKEKGRAVR